MRISLPPISSRYFPLYWGLISCVAAISYWALAVCTVVSMGYLTNLFQGSLFSLLSPLLIFCGFLSVFLMYPFVLNSAPWIMLKPYLRFNQKIAWIANESFSQLAFVIGTWGMMTKYTMSNILGAYPFLEVLMVMLVWIIVSIIQISSISFKYPKRWLLYSVTAWIVLSLLTWFILVSIPKNAPPEIVTVFASLFLKSGLNGLGLYFSGMNIRKARADFER